MWSKVGPNNVKVPKVKHVRCQGFSWFRAKIWNNLPEDIKSTTNSDSFKLKVKKIFGIPFRRTRLLLHFGGAGGQDKVSGRWCKWKLWWISSTHNSLMSFSTEETLFPHYCYYSIYIMRESVKITLKAREGSLLLGLAFLKEGGRERQGPLHINSSASIEIEISIMLRPWLRQINYVT